MPHVTVQAGTADNPVYQVGGKSFIFFRNPRPDAFDPERASGTTTSSCSGSPSEGDKLAMVQDESTPYFTTPHFKGHLSVLLRGSRIGEISYEELAEVVQDAWLSRASRAARRHLAPRAPAQVTTGWNRWGWSGRQVGMSPRVLSQVAVAAFVGLFALGCQADGAERRALSEPASEPTYDRRDGSGRRAGRVRQDPRGDAHEHRRRAGMGSFLSRSGRAHGARGDPVRRADEPPRPARRPDRWRRRRAGVRVSGDLQSHLPAADRVRRRLGRAGQGTDRPGVRRKARRARLVRARS